MKNKWLKQIDKLRLFIQLVFLTGSILLMLNDTTKLWGSLFLFGIILSTFLGRFFCGWMCPIGTILSAQTRVYKKLHVRRMKIPTFCQKNAFKGIVIGLVLSVIVISKSMDLSLNIIQYLIFGSILMSFVFEEAFWHRLCPFGMILSISGRNPFMKLKIDEKKCINCGLCQETCPNNSIITIDNNKKIIVMKDCLLCQKCQTICPVNAIEYTKR